MSTLSVLTERCYIGQRSKNHSEQKDEREDPGEEIREGGFEWFVLCYALLAMAKLR